MSMSGGSKGEQNQGEDDADEALFASWGGSLMQDLLADLHLVGDVQEGETGWLSLEQLEQELAQHVPEVEDQEDDSDQLKRVLMLHPSTGSTASNLTSPWSQPAGANVAYAATGQAFPLFPSSIPSTNNTAHLTSSAASLVMRNAVNSSTTASWHDLASNFPLNSSGETANMATTPLDAWSASLQKFTAASLEQDFLQADSVRRQAQQQAPQPPAPSTSWQAFEEYNPAEQVVVAAPPPGWSSSASTAAAPPPIPPPGLGAVAAALPTHHSVGLPPSNAAVSQPVSLLQEGIEIMPESSAPPSKVTKAVAPIMEEKAASIPAITSIPPAPAAVSAPTNLLQAPTRPPTNAVPAVANKALLEQAAARLVQQLQRANKAAAVETTTTAAIAATTLTSFPSEGANQVGRLIHDNNKLEGEEEGDEDAPGVSNILHAITKPTPPTPQNSVTVAADGSVIEPSASVHGNSIHSTPLNIPPAILEDGLPNQNVAPDSAGVATEHIGKVPVGAPSPHGPAGQSTVFSTPPVAVHSASGAPPVMMMQSQAPMMIPPIMAGRGVMATGVVPPLPIPPHQHLMMMMNSPPPLPPQATRPAMTAWGTPPPHVLPFTEAGGSIPLMMTPPPPPPPTPQTPVVISQIPVMAQLPYYCNPDPRAPPINVSMHIQRRYMPTRDILYVIHSILKPILALGVAPDDYHVLYFLKVSGGAIGSAARGGPRHKKTSVDLIQEMTSRSLKAKEWSQQHAVLGHIAKSNVARPRALLSQPVSSNPEEEVDGTSSDAATTKMDHQQHRATVWRARIVIDQAYQAFGRVVQVWRNAGPQQGGGVPAELQPHILKLMKCMGLQVLQAEDESMGGASNSVSRVTVYSVDKSALQVVLKLQKGRVLLCRVLDQALLPFKAAMALFPVVLQILLSSSHSSSQETESATDLRMFDAWTRILTLQTAPQAMDGNILLKALDACHQNSNGALSSAHRMQCVHALLQRGGLLASASTDEVGGADFTAQWKNAEDAFLHVLESS